LKREQALREISSIGVVFLQSILGENNSLKVPFPLPRREGTKGRGREFLTFDKSIKKYLQKDFSLFISGAALLGPPFFSL
jgi:hypothetical protein